MDKPFFIPLNAKFYDAFICGDKNVEYRLHGARWNAKTCYQGRKVILSRGYGKQHRAEGVIQHAYVEQYRHLPGLLKLSLREIYKVDTDITKFMCIQIALSVSKGDAK